MKRHWNLQWSFWKIRPILYKLACQIFEMGISGPKRFILLCTETIVQPFNTGLRVSSKFNFRLLYGTWRGAPSRLRALSTESTTLKTGLEDIKRFASHLKHPIHFPFLFLPVPLLSGNPPPPFLYSYTATLLWTEHSDILFHIKCISLTLLWLHSVFYYIFSCKGYTTEPTSIYQVNLGPWKCNWRSLKIQFMTDRPTDGHEGS